MRAGRATRRALAGVALLALACVLSGCSMAPRGSEPLESSELQKTIDALKRAQGYAVSYRGTGTGEILVSGRTLKLAFAVVYERPGWLRADLRPQLGTLGANLTALGTMENGCARFFFPARLLVVTGCISDVADDIELLDPAALALGLPDASLFSNLSDATATRRNRTVRVQGHCGDAVVTLDIDEKLPAVTSIELAAQGSDEGMRITYGGYGWKDGVVLPRTVELSAFEGTSRELGLSIRYDTLKPGGPVDRAEYKPVIPEGVLEMDWKELNFGR
jgi:hypothetical protein